MKGMLASERRAMDELRAVLGAGPMATHEELLVDAAAFLRAGSGVVRDGLGLISLERWRQLGKWSADHDDEHADGLIAAVAAELAVQGTQAFVVDSQGVLIADPWALVIKHRDDRVRQLEIAGALIAAELDRLLRLRRREEER